jgi:hypothetical protein
MLTRFQPPASPGLNGFWNDICIYYVQFGMYEFAHYRSVPGEYEHWEASRWAKEIKMAFVSKTSLMILTKFQ